MTEQVRYAFSADEIVALGDTLARMLRLLGEAERNKAAIVAQLGADIKAARQKCDDLANRISLGYEMRPVEVESVLNQPKNGQKEIIRVDTGEILRTETMTDQERQGTLFEGDGKGKRK